MKDTNILVSKIKNILGNYDFLSSTIDWIKKHKKSILNLALNKDINESDFYKITSLLSTQARSSLWENYFRIKNKFERVKKNENKGDLKKDEKYYEYKISFNDQINFRLIQIRIWQECDYIFQFLTLEKVYTFYLNKNDMKKELELCKATVAHGTKKSNLNNENIELTLTITKESKEWNRWVKKYQNENKT